MEKPHARSQSLGVHKENLITNSWKIVSAGSIGNHSQICETGIYYNHDELSQSAKSADMKIIGASISMNQQGSVTMWIQ